MYFEAVFYIIFPIAKKNICLNCDKENKKKETRKTWLIAHLKLVQNSSMCVKLHIVATWACSSVARGMEISLPSILYATVTLCNTATTCAVVLRGWEINLRLRLRLRHRHINLYVSFHSFCRLQTHTATPPLYANWIRNEPVKLPKMLHIYFAAAILGRFNSSIPSLHSSHFPLTTLSSCVETIVNGF